MTVTGAKALATPSWLPEQNGAIDFPSNAAQEYWSCPNQAVIGPDAGIARRLIEARADGMAIDPFTRQPIRQLTALEKNATRNCPYAVDQWLVPPSKTIALTYDDGPHPVWSNQIMDVLEAEHVRATFFVVGDNVQAHPEVFARMVSRHSVGSHTMNHADVSDFNAMTPAAIREDLLRASRVMDAHGATTTAFRLPYTGDDLDSTVRSIAGIAAAQQLGMPQISFTYDSHDYQEYGQGQASKKLTLDGRPQVVIMHDAGGDRAKTVKLTQQVIRRAKQAGYRFVTINELLHPVKPVVQSETAVDMLAGWTIGAQESWLSWTQKLLLAATGIGLFTTVVMLGLSLMGARTFWRRYRFRRSDQSPSGEHLPDSVTVLIAAHQEELTIGSTLRALADSVYPESMQIVVVNDGSTDQTSAVAREFAKQLPEDITMIIVDRPNGGKSAALNYAINTKGVVTGSVVVTIDADTLVDPYTLARLVQPFADSRVGAVAGRVAVQNRGSTIIARLLSRWQSEDYAVGVSVARMAQSTVDAIMVVPGACSAWRTEALRIIGGFPTDTMAEDADAGLQLQRLGYRVANVPNAVAHTQVPETVAALLRQQYRWHFGVIQVLFKHRHIMGNPRRFGAKAVVMAYSLVNSLAPLATPLIWLLMAAALWQGRWKITLGYYGLFTMVRVIMACAAMWNLREWSWNPLWALVLHRLINDPLQMIVAYRSLYFVLSGRLVKWGHAPRLVVEVATA